MKTALVLMWMWGGYPESWSVVSRPYTVDECERRRHELSILIPLQNMVCSENEPTWSPKR